MSAGYNTDGLFTFPQTESPTLNCFESIECTIAFDVSDWQSNRRQAWIYGIVFGIDCEDFEDCKRRFKWDDADIERLKKYHKQWVQFHKMCALMECEEVKKLPAADVVEVVRCRDCKFNPLNNVVGCPMANLAYDGNRWCWKGTKQ